jgi:phage shock protein A
VITQTQQELSQFRRDVDHLTREIAQLRRQLELAIAQEAAQANS